MRGNGLLAMILLTCVWLSCQEQITNDPLVAQVYNKRLFLSDLHKVIPVVTNKEDSILLANAYIENWIRESLMMHEAERNIPVDLEIDQMVDDYRSSLVMHTYEKRLIENLLDSVISEQELVEYYEENKSQYILESIILQGYFIKFASDTLEENQLERINNLWILAQGDTAELYFPDLISELDQIGALYYLDSSVWHKLEDITALMPSGSLNAGVIQFTRDFQFEDDNHYYFLKVLRTKDKTEVAPLSFIESQATQVILHKRKLELLKKIRNELYDRALSGDRIKLFIQ